MASIAYQRLHNELVTNRKFDKPEEVVAWLGAVQSQDYGGGKWAVGLRLNGVTEAAIEKACSDGKILRTHVLRPTWHFVTPADIRWMLKLTAPRIHVRMNVNNRKLELDAALFAKTNALLAKTLQGGKQLTRSELTKMFTQAGIDVTNLLRLGHILSHAELEGVICSGAWRGKQPTWALLDERAPQAKTLERDESLAELARRYFISHGPATLKDYVWWSGLTAPDARAGLEMVKAQLESETIDRETWWFAPEQTPAIPASPFVLLLPNYDEYIVAYTDRSAIFDTTHNNKLDTRGNVLFNNTIVIDSQVVGTWRHTFRKKSVVIETALFRSLTDAETAALNATARSYGNYLGLSVEFQA